MRGNGTGPAGRWMLGARRGEAGFTLVEVVVAVSILGVIALAIGAAFVVSAHDSIGVSDRFAESQDAQIASAFLATDVQSNQALATASCSSGLPVIGFGYDDGTVASYCYGSGKLTRDYNGSPAQSSVLVKKGGGTPTLACVDPSGCAAGSRPNKVTITVTEAQGYTYSLSGSRRPYINGGAAVPPPPAPYGLLAFGGGKVAIQGNNSNLVVHGPMIVDSTASDAVNIGGSANPPSPRVRVYSNSNESAPGTFAIRSPGGCSRCSAATVYPYPPSSYTTSIADPFAGLPYPDEAPYIAANQVYVDGKYHGPGVYRTLPLSISSDTALAGGTYILESGIHISGGTIDGSSGVLLFNGCGQNSPACAAGAGTGQVVVDGKSSLSLTPFQSGSYQLLAIWQPPGNINGITLAGQTATSVLRGIVYAPGSSGLSIGSGSGSVAIQIWCVAGTAITISGNATATIGQ